MLESFSKLISFYEKYVEVFGERLIVYIKSFIVHLELHFLAKDTRIVHEGEVYFVNFGSNIKSEFSGKRPAVVLSSPPFHVGRTLIVAPITSYKEHKLFLADCIVSKGIAGLPSESIIKLGNLREISKARLIYKLGNLPQEVIILIRKELPKIFL